MAARRNLFLHEGEYWTIAFDGGVVRLRDAKGVRYLVRLLERPGESVPASELFSGQPIPDAAAAERARINVTRAIASAQRRIAAVHRALAAHLEATLHKGTHCSYRPDPRVPIRWSTKR